MLLRAKALYKDRKRIALATLMIVFSITFYVFYVPTGIANISDVTPRWIPGGWAQGFDLVYSFNTVGFFLAFAMIAFAYAFWSWAYLPAPAITYTLGVINGIFGTHSKVKRSIGRAFHVVSHDGIEIDLKCSIKQYGTDDWFVYRLESMPIDSPELEQIALRHGFSTKDRKLVSWVSHNELHSRSLLLLKAIRIASS